MKNNAIVCTGRSRIQTLVYERCVTQNLSHPHYYIALSLQRDSTVFLKIIQFTAVCFIRPKHTML